MQRGDSVEKSGGSFRETSFVKIIYEIVKERSDQTPEEIYSQIKE